MRIGIISLGCAKNLVDTENLLGLLQQSNQELVTDREEADAIIINTCGFIDPAKQEAIDTILDAADLKKKNLKKLIVMGCLAQRYKKDLEQELPEVDRIISIDEYPKIGTILTEVLGERISNDYGLAPRTLSGKPWMAYLSIADGCPNRCAFCAIPLIRGNLHSLDEEDILTEARRVVVLGVKELILVAQDCSRYGWERDHQSHLVELLKKLDEIEGVHWIRMLYLYPDEMPEELPEVILHSKHILPYFDIPTQSGSNAVLKSMYRKTNREQILNITKKIRDVLPNAVLRTSLIAGFPTETEEDFNDTLSMIKEVQWNHLGAFTFSKEEGTAAYDMEDPISEEVKEERKQKIMELQAEIAENLLQKEIGRIEEVMVERVDPLTGMYIGRTAGMAPDNVDGVIRFRSDSILKPGDFTNVLITKTAGQNLIGEEKKEKKA